MEEYVVGISILMMLIVFGIILFFVKIYKIVVRKNKEIDIKDQVIEIQKEIIEHQPGLITRNHDN